MISHVKPHNTSDRGDLITKKSCKRNPIKNLTNFPIQGNQGGSDSVAPTDLYAPIQGSFLVSYDGHTAKAPPALRSQPTFGHHAKGG